MITLRSIRKQYRDQRRQPVEVLSGVDLSVKKGEFVAIVGHSGCGKSTLLNIVGGLDVDFQGEVEVAGQKLVGLKDRALARFRNRTVGFVFQSFNLLAPLTALENVMLPSYFGGFSADDSVLNDKPGSILSLKEQALAALARVNLSNKADQRPAQLSGGERQRVAIARALLVRPPIILADEPTGSLDAKTGEQIIDLFARLAAEDQLTLMVVTHEERMSSVANRILRLSDGKLVEQASLRLGPIPADRQSEAVS